MIRPLSIPAVCSLCDIGERNYESAAAAFDRIKDDTSVPAEQVRVAARFMLDCYNAWQRAELDHRCGRHRTATRIVEAAV